MIERRHTNRRDFREESVPPDVIYELTNAADQEEASLVQIVEPEQKIAAAQLCQEAEAIQIADPRYRAELETWTTTDLHRTMDCTGPNLTKECLCGRSMEYAGLAKRSGHIVPFAMRP